MQLTVVGAGVVGATFAWQLAEAGHTVRVVARPQRRASLLRGVPLRCLDQRRLRVVRHATLRPMLAERLDPSSPVDLVLVCVQRHQHAALLPALAALPATTPLLFLHQQWDDALALTRALGRERCLLGAPAVGGGHTRDGIFCWLPPQATAIGTAGGEPSPYLQAAARLLRSAGLKVDRHAPMPSLLAARAVVRVALAGAALEAGSVQALAASPALLHTVVQAVRQGLAICRAQGLSVETLPFVAAYHSPSGLTLRALQKMLRRPTTRCALGGCLAHTIDELRGLGADILATGRAHAMPSEALARLNEALNKPAMVWCFVRGQPEAYDSSWPRCPTSCAACANFQAAECSETPPRPY
jgi:2-dehydropantoate 2-reductase